MKAIPSLQHIRIVVVEDDEDTRELLAFALQETGAEVELFGAAAPALASLRERPAHFVLCDCSLPDMTGRALVAAARADALAQVFVGMCGRRAEPEDGFDHFRLKPIDIRELLATLVAARP